MGLVAMIPGRTAGFDRFFLPLLVGACGGERRHCFRRWPVDNYLRRNSVVTAMALRSIGSSPIGLVDVGPEDAMVPTPSP
jgi:hypothetical protein